MQRTPSSIDALQVEAKSLQSQLSGVIHHPLNGVVPLLLAPLMATIVKSMKKAAAPPAAATAAQQNRPAYPVNKGYHHAK